VIELDYLDRTHTSLSTILRHRNLTWRIFTPCNFLQDRAFSSIMANTIELAQVCMSPPLFVPSQHSPQPKQTGKRDHLKSLEKKYQTLWSSQNLFQVNAPPADAISGLSPTQIKEKYPKWFGNFPFPYMNGSLHLGHAFTISKIEFAAGYQRMLGKRALFPHGFHVTGMPIKVWLVLVLICEGF